MRSATPIGPPPLPEEHAAPVGDPASRIRKLGIWAALGLWALVAVYYLFAIVGFENLALLLPHELAGLFAGLALPAILVAVLATHLDRARDIRAAAEPVQRLLEELTNPDTAANRRLDAVQRQVAEQTQALDAATERARSQMAEMAALIARQSTQLREQADTLDGTSGSLGQRLADYEQRFGRALDGIGKRIQDYDQAVDQAGERLSRITQASTKRVLSTLGDFDGATQRLAESAQLAGESAQLISGQIAARAEDLQSAGEAAEGRLETMRARLDGQHGQLQGVADRLAAEAARIERAVSGQADALDGALSGAEQRVDRLLGRLGTRGQEIGAVLADSQTTLDAQTALLVEHRDAIAAAADQVRGAADEASAGLWERTEKLAGLVASLRKDGGSITETLKAQAEGMQAHVTAAQAQLGTFIEELGTGRTEAEALSTEILEQMDRVGQRIARRANQSWNLARASEKKLVDLADQLERKTTDLSGAGARAANELSAAFTKVGERSAVFEGSVSVTLDKARALTDRLEALSGRTDDTVTATTEALDTLITELETRHAQIGQKAQEAGGALAGAGTEARRQIETLAKVSADADQNLNALSRGLKSATDDVHDTVGRMSVRMEDLRKSIGGQSADLSATLDRSSFRLNEAAGSLKSQVEEVMEATQGLKRALDGAGDHAQQELGRVQDSAEGIKVALADMGGVFRSEAENASLRAEEVVDRLDGLGVRLAEIANGFADKVVETAGQIEAVRDKLGEDVATVERARDRIGDSLGSTVERIASSIQTLGQDNAQLLARLDSAAETALREVRRLGDAADRSTASLRDAADLFVTQAGVLDEHAEAAEQHYARLRAISTAGTREAFLDSCKFILAELSSLSVDVAQALHVDVPETLWRKFRDGDRTAMTRHLLAHRSDLPFDVMRRRFEEDTEFRTATLQYLRQFEELIDQAVNMDGGDLLSTTLMASDVGKVYLMLNHAVGKGS